MIRNWDQLEQIQPLVMNLLKQSILKKRVSHAYLFDGMRGTGKKEIGTVFAQALFCNRLENGYKPCGKCIQCQRVQSGNHPDFHKIEPDGRSIKKEQVVDLQQEFSKKAMESNNKVYLIVDADKMTTNAANSLLKFLEEPNSETTAILVTENGHKILPTILSRCQHIVFKPLSKKELILRLTEEGINKERAPLYAHLTNSIDEALMLAHDEWFLQAEKIVLKLYEIITNQGFEDAMLHLQTEWNAHFKTREQIQTGLDLLLFIFKDILYIQLGSEDEIAFWHQRNYLEKRAIKIAHEKLISQIISILEAKKRLQSNVSGLLLMEQLLIQIGRD